MPSPLDTLDFPLPLVAFLSLSNFFRALSLPFYPPNFEGFFLLHQKNHSRLLVIRSKDSHEHEVTYFINALCFEHSFTADCHLSVHPISSC